MLLSQPSLRKQVYGDHLIKVLLPCGDNLQVLYEKSAVHNGLEIVGFQASKASKSGVSSELVIIKSFTHPAQSIKQFLFPFFLSVF